MKLKQPSYILSLCCVAILPATAEGFSTGNLPTHYHSINQRIQEEKHNPHPERSSRVVSFSTNDSNTVIVENGSDKISSIRVKLDEILRSKSTSLFDELTEIRESGSQDDVEAFLNTILAIIDNENDQQEVQTLPWWTKFRFTARVSKRARIASLCRVLDFSTPTVEETESLGNDEDAKKRRRRRALLVLLRSLAGTQVDDEDEGDAVSKGKKKNRPIYKIEKAAKNDMKNSISFKDIESRLPPGLESPKYEVIVRRPNVKGGYEIREYEPFSVCSVPMKKPRPDGENTDQKLQNPQLAGASSFGALAGYLFGKNEEQKAMKMTTPVFTQGNDESKEMSFVLPSDYWSDEGITKAPTPLQQSLVTVKRNDGGFRAATMFGGFASKKDIEAKKELLLKGLDSDKEWVAIKRDVTIAQYNDPFTPPWKRRNEVSVAVKKRAD